MAYQDKGCLRYCKSTSFQANHNATVNAKFAGSVVCDTAKVRVFKQITTVLLRVGKINKLFAILQKYEFSSKSQLPCVTSTSCKRCLRYCKSTSFQANHNGIGLVGIRRTVVCDTAKVRVFKQITTSIARNSFGTLLFAILQKYEFSSKSQHNTALPMSERSCLRYCKSTSFQANHNLTTR